MRVLLIRHGETEHNAERLAMGRDDIPLNERGRAQAVALARRLAGGGGFGELTAIYASPLQRALDTARAIGEAAGLPVRVEPGLIEMDIGEVEGIGYGEVRERYPEFARAWLSDELADVPMPGGETLRQVQERAWRAVETVRERHSEGTAALVTHNFVILTLLCRALDLPLARFRRLRQDLAAVSALELPEGRAMVLTMNDRCHLS